MNRTRASSVDAFGTRNQRNRIYPALEASDGSTLSLNFTQMSSLDSRFTFTRSNTSNIWTTATFINSRGLVQLADHNLVGNSAFVGSSVGTGWTPTAGGTFANSGIGSITASVTTSNQSWISRTFVTKPGIRYSASVNVTSIAGTLNYNQVFAVAGSISSDVFYRNGSVVTAGTTAQTGLLTIIFTAGAGGTNTFRAGVGASGTNQENVTVVFDSPRAVEGEITQPTYFVSPSGSEYQAPRFDYNPNTLAPRGLLIEGGTSNIVRYSETLEITGGFWGYNAATRTVESSDVNPTGGTGSISFAPSSDGSSRYAGVFLTGQTTASIYTYSVWLKGKGTTACVISIQSSAGGQNATMTILSQPAGANASITGNGTGFPRISNLSTTGWTKVQVVLSANLGGTGTLNVFMYPNDTSSQTTADSLYAWGAQLEVGVQASSYIPTGSSTVARTRDELTMANISALNFNQSGGTVFMRLEENPRDQNTNPYFGQFEVSPSGRGWAFARFNHSASAGRRMFPIAFSGPSATLISSSTVTRSVSGEYKFATTLEPSVARMTVVVSGGSPVVTTATAGTLTTIGALKFNNTSESAATDFSSVWLAEFKYWPSVLPNETLKTLTL